jgi:hypothetical protein
MITRVNRRRAGASVAAGGGDAAPGEASAAKPTCDQDSALSRPSLKAVFLKSDLHLALKREALEQGRSLQEHVDTLLRSTLGVAA